ncbi:MAG TPA: RHS repeat-associated core domain-containing protein, partial [Fimbriimonadaceae bacterium]|nr:RHS repeat-associated core domain-containing protein [Fimbriimonadaceae bacterium]
SGSGEPFQRYCANLGHVQDEESGLIYMRARYYEPWTGRFVSEDSARDGKNWYIYCNNDPLNYIDRSGQNAEAAFWGIISTILMIMAILAGFGEANLTMAISRAARDAAQLRSMYGLGLATLDEVGNAINRLNDLESKSKNLRKLSKFSLAGAILGRILMLEALLIDINIAADGYGGLEITFGEG